MYTKTEISQRAKDMTTRRTAYNTRSRKGTGELDSYEDEVNGLELTVDNKASSMHDHVKFKDPESKGKEENDVFGPGVCSEGLGRDKYNIAILMFLYVLQGIPLGIAGAVPYLLQSRQVNYKDQAIFSFVYWPFSVKLLWAPIVDAAYFRTFGRRKSWLVPVQYLIGIFMLYLSWHVKELLGEGDTGSPVNVLTLTVTFFFLNFLAATQDIAVDGWALTMLARYDFHMSFFSIFFSLQMKIIMHSFINHLVTF